MILRILIIVLRYDYCQLMLNNMGESKLQVHISKLDVHILFRRMFIFYFGDSNINLVQYRTMYYI